MKIINKVLLMAIALMAGTTMYAQDKIVHPEISYAGTPRTVTLSLIHI